MYYLIAGHHPIYSSSDGKDTYYSKLREREFTFPENFTELAKDFFLRLCNRNVEARYSASIALNHPWITRNFTTQIPLTIYEEGVQEQCKVDLATVLKGLFFVGCAAAAAENKTAIAAAASRIIPVHIKKSSALLLPFAKKDLNRQLTLDPGKGHDLFLALENANNKKMSSNDLSCKATPIGGTCKNKHSFVVRPTIQQPLCMTRRSFMPQNILPQHDLYYCTNRTSLPLIKCTSKPFLKPDPGPFAPRQSRLFEKTLDSPGKENFMQISRPSMQLSHIILKPIQIVKKQTEKIIPATRLKPIARSSLIQKNKGKFRTALIKEKIVKYNNNLKKIY